MKKTVAESFYAFANTRNFGEVDSSADDHRIIVNCECGIGNCVQKRLSPR
jgi:hypothetical protein